jgi:hypothetical protein
MKQETIEEAAEKYWAKQPYNEDAFEEGAKWQQERSYSEDDLEEAFKSGFTNCYNNNNLTFGEWFEQFKKTKYDRSI